MEGTAGYVALAFVNSCNGRTQALAEIGFLSKQSLTSGYSRPNADSIAADPLRLRILRQVRALQLPDCWVGAGFVRSAIWDHLHQRSSSPLPADIDVIWFDSERSSPELDARIEATLQSMDHTLEWSVKNQARMHLRNDDRPYLSATEAMVHWPETATAVAVRLGAHGVIEIAAPLGLDDLFNLVVRPTVRFQGEKGQAYRDRLRAKNWLATWPRLKVFSAD